MIYIPVQSRLAVVSSDEILEKNYFFSRRVFDMKNWPLIFLELNVFFAGKYILVYYPHLCKWPRASSRFYYYFFKVSFYKAGHVLSKYILLFFLIFSSVFFWFFCMTPNFVLNLK